MFKSYKVCKTIIQLNNSNKKYLFQRLITRHLSDNKSDNNVNNEQVLNNNNKSIDDKKDDIFEKLTFKKAFEKFERIKSDSEKKGKETVDPVEPFPTLLRHSPLIQLGDPYHKVVVGKIVNTVEDDLYIDFGSKFCAVCRRPQRNPNEYVRGSKVKIRINDLELSERFLGSDKDMTLLEADVTLIGIVWSPARRKDTDSLNVTNDQNNELEI